MQRVFFIAVSLILHGALVVGLVDFGSAGRKSPAAAVYEVSIVGAVPAAAYSPGRVAGKGAAARSGKKFVRHSGKATRDLGDVRKERSIKDGNSEPQISDVEQDVPEFEIEDDFRFSDSVNASPGAVGSNAAGTATAEGIWAGRVRAVVWQVWKFPPELTSLDTAINVTYLIKVGRNGDLLERDLVLSSGNKPFDRSVMLALNKIKRLPVPPVQLLAGRDRCEILMNFSPPQGEQ